MSYPDNQKIAQLFRNIAAAYQIKNFGNQFQIRAYENAATSIEHATQEVSELWKEGKLDEIPGVGSRLKEYLDELMKTGKVKHFQEVLEEIPEAALIFLNIPGVGPKTAYKLAIEGKADSLAHLKTRIESGELKKTGFSDKAISNLERGLAQLQGQSHRLLLPQALEVAGSLIEKLAKSPEVKEAHPLGSLRRMVPTVGDIDIGVSTTNPDQTIANFVSLPEVKSVIGQGHTKASVVLNNGLQVDLLTGPPEHFGSLLQHFTGSKSHNIHLREVARDKGYSLSENGARELSDNTLIKCPEERDVYKLLSMSTPPPEIREDTGEIELALQKNLPILLNQEDIKGDLHTHTTYSDGVSTLNEMVKAATNLDYKYFASTDHSYPNLEFDKRIKEIDHINYSGNTTRVIKGLEVNITTEASLQVPDRILEMHEFNIGSIHSSFSQTKEQLTQRVIMALKHPLISMIGHPTGRLLGERPGYELDWEKVFNAATQYDKVLEVDGYPNRSDLPDPLIREAIKRRIKISVDTDAHHINHLSLMKFAVMLARRGWATPELVINTWDLNKLLEYLKKPRIK